MTYDPIDEPGEQAATHDPLYDDLHDRPEFTELRRRYRAFILPATIAFIAWYSLYVLMSMFAGDFMGTKLIGNINVALAFGLLQFITTFVIAWLYSRYSNTRLDPLARQLNDDYDAALHGREG